MRKAFTLMEVNLAILIMAGGILSIVGLYSFGYRENRQSREDVASAAFAEAVMSPIVIAASSTNLLWSKFKRLPDYPSAKQGWRNYVDDDGHVHGNANEIAKGAFNDVLSALNSAAEGGLDGIESASWPTGNEIGNLKGGLVIRHNNREAYGSNAVIRISFRAAKNTNELMSAPLYYTEVRFQGIQDNK